MLQCVHKETCSRKSDWEISLPNLKAILACQQTLSAGQQQACTYIRMPCSSTLVCRRGFTTACRPIERTSAHPHPAQQTREARHMSRNTHLECSSDRLKSAQLVRLHK